MEMILVELGNFETISVNSPLKHTLYSFINEVLVINTKYKVNPFLPGNR